MSATQELLVKIKGDIGDLKAKLSEASSSVKDFSSNMTKAGDMVSSVGSTLTKTVTAPLAGIGVASLKTAADFEQGMKEVQAISGASGDDLIRLSDKAKEMGAKTKFSATESAEAFKYMAMAGWDTEKMLNGIEGIMNLAAASGENLGSVSDIVTDALTGFGLAAEDSAHFADILATASSSANTNVSMLGESFKYAAPVAGAMGYSAEDTAVALGLMANSGIKASQAGTSLRTALTNMANPTDKMANAMSDLGIEITNSDGSMKSLDEVMRILRSSFSELSEAQQVQAASSIFGKNAMAGMLAIINASDEDFNKLTNDINNCDGSAQNMADTMNDSLSGAITLMKSALEGVSITIGSKLAPYIRQAAEYITSLAEKFSSLSPEMQDTIIKFGLIAAAIGPVILILGKLMTAIGSISGGLSTVMAALGGTGGAATAAGSAFGAFSSVILPVAGILVGIGTAAYSMIQSFGGVQGTLEVLKQSFDRIIESCKQVAERLGLDGAIEKLKDKLKGLLDALGNMNSFWTIVIEILTRVAMIISGNLMVAFNLLVDAVTAAIEIITGLINIISGLADIIVGVLTGDMEKAGEGFKKIWEGIKQVTQGAIDFVVGLVSNFVNNIIQFFSNLKHALVGDPIVIDMWNDIKNCFSQGIQKVQEFVKNMVDKVVEFFTNLKDKTIEKVNQIKDKVVEGFNNIKEKVTEVTNNIKENVSQKWSDLKEKVSTTTDNLKQTVSDKFNNLKENVTTTVDTIKSNAADKFNQMKENLTDAAANIKESVGEKFNEVKEKIGDAVENAKSTASDKFNDMRATIGDRLSDILDTARDWADNLRDRFDSVDLESTGSNIIRGLSSGLRDAWGSVSDWVSDKCSWIVGKFKKAMDIHSPSRVFKDIGENIDLGLVEGLESGERAISTQMDRLSNVVTGNFNPDIPNPTGGNGPQGSRITVNLNGSYMFQDKESMDYFMERMGLALQRI